MARLVRRPTTPPVNEEPSRIIPHLSRPRYVNTYVHAEVRSEVRVIWAVASPDSWGFHGQCYARGAPGRAVLDPAI
ncbi:unnamed protein product, partial [Iphiclides podalirius]